jgi:hypothetical protein
MKNGSDLRFEGKEESELLLPDSDHLRHRHETGS